jgi:hypothetical protein
VADSRRALPVPVFFRHGPLEGTVPILELEIAESIHAYHSLLVYLRGYACLPFQRNLLSFGTSEVTR